MNSNSKSVLFLNGLLWLVAGLLHPIASLLPAGNGETPKIFSLFIPLAFIALAYISTTLLYRAQASPSPTQLP